MTDYLLIVLTLAVSVVGIYWEEPFRGAPGGSGSPKSYQWVRPALLALAIISSAAAAYKAHDDNDDKAFLKSALKSGLVPPHAVFDGFYEDIKGPAAARGFNVESLDGFNCIHFDEGVTCFLANPDGTKRGTLVLNRIEVADMYANYLDRKSNRTFCENLFTKQAKPSTDSEEFKDKAGIVGFLTFYTIHNRYPENYFYDGTGIRVIDGGKSFFVSADEVNQITAGNALDVYHKIEELFREKFKGS